MLEHTKEAKKVYQSAKWAKVRRAYLEKRHYICERCGKPASIVHHKRYLDSETLKDCASVYGERNLEALCLDCHNREHFRNRSVREGVAFDGSGGISAGISSKPPANGQTGRPGKPGDGLNFYPPKDFKDREG